MSLVSWAAGKMGYQKRAAASRPVDVWPASAAFHGYGLAAQPSTATLLAESIGIPDTATRAIANRVASLCPEVYIERDVGSDTTEDEILDDHPLKRLLDRPHPNLSRSQVLRLTAQYIVTVGEAYWIKVANRLGTPTELHIVPPGMVCPLVRSNVIHAYEVTDANGARTQYPADVFIRFYFPDPEDPWRSEGYLGPTGVAADTHKFASQHLRSHYQNDATPRVVLEANEHAEEWTSEDRTRFWNLWRERFQSRTGSHVGVPAITPTGYKLVELALQSGADVTPLLEYLRDDLLMGYAVPRSVLGQVVSGDRSSAETNQWVFDRYAVSPITGLIADALTLQLAPDFDSSLRVRFEDFVSEDKDHTLKRELQDLTMMVRTVNEIRVERGEDEVEWGDEPIGTPQDVPYDPEAAAERVNRPPPVPGAPGAAPAPAGEPAEEDDERLRLLRQQAKEVREQFRAKRRRKAA